jgi:hypothetical protein
MAAADAAAAAAAAALGLGEESEEESIDADDPPMDEEAIKELRFENRSSLIRVFDYTELSAEVIQDKLGLNEPVDLIITWDSDSALESAVTTSFKEPETMLSTMKFRSFDSRCRRT